jgi:hypothetical protein
MKEGYVSVVANHSEDQPLADCLTAVITAQLDRLLISGSMKRMLMASESGATDTELAALLTTELGLSDGSDLTK